MVDANKIPPFDPNDQVLISRKEFEKLKADQARMELLEHELEKIKKYIFGAKSERFVPADSAQLSLDLGLENTTGPEPKTEQISYTRQKGGSKGHGRNGFPDTLEREEVVLIPDGDLTGAVKIGEVRTELLDYRESKFVVLCIIRYKYLLPQDQGIVIADLPSLPIPRSYASAGLLAFLIISKFVDHLPFYRQRQIFKRQGIDLSESTINDWFRAVCNLLEPLYNCLKKELLISHYLSADETPIPVLTDDKPGATHKGYFWVYFSHALKLVLFDYRKGRGQEGPKELLAQYSGTLQCDGYSAYDIFEREPYNLTLLACFAHVRRKFDEAKLNDKIRAEYMLGKIQKLYRIERQADDQNLDDGMRLELRHSEAIPILDEIHAWLKENILTVLPKSAIGQAIAYTLHLWPRLIRYTENGIYRIDNNLIENTIRPVALGRKNYLFAGSHEAAQRAAMIYSFFATCKLNGIEPYNWLKTVLERIPDHSIQRLEELLPQNLR